MLKKLLKKEITNLYRYQPFNEQYSREIFNEGKLYFPSPSKFNDPFDCKALFTFEGSEDEDFTKFFMGYYKNLYPDFTEADIQQKIDATLREGHHKNSAWRGLHYKEFKKILEFEGDKLGVLCLSEKPDDILMWAHYADRHRGFCLQFDKAGLISWRFCAPVKYQKLYPTFHKFIPLMEESRIDRLFLLTKSDHWKYEREWRVIVEPPENGNPDNRKIHFPQEALTGIIFGVQMHECDKNKVRLWLKGKTPPPKLYQAKKREHEFALDIEEID